MPDKLFRLGDHLKELRFNSSIEASAESNGSMSYTRLWSEVHIN